MADQATASHAIDRPAELADFLSHTPWAGARRVPLAQDASVRQYERLHKKDKTAILVDARPPLEDVDKYIYMAEKFRNLGFNVPEIYETDSVQGILIVEDLGDDLYFHLVRDGRADLQEIYAAATDVLVAINQADPEIALAETKDYTDALWLKRLREFPDLYWPHVMGGQASAQARESYESVWSDILKQAHTLAPVLQHGDFLSQNLLWMPARAGLHKCGLLDFQDMTDARGNTRSSPAFDLVFLMQDVRLELPEALEAEMKTRFLERLPYAADVFNQEYAILGTAQAMKCLGLFARLAYGRGDKRFLEFIPYCQRNVRRNLRHPVLAPLKKWLETYLPEETFYV